MHSSEDTTSSLTTGTPLSGSTRISLQGQCITAIPTARLEFKLASQLPQSMGYTQLRNRNTLADL